MIFVTLTGLSLAQNEKKTLKLKVPELNCKMCSFNVEQSLRKLKGINKYELNLDYETVTVQFDENKISAKEIIDALKKIGYDPYEIK